MRNTEKLNGLAHSFRYITKGILTGKNIKINCLNAGNQTDFFRRYSEVIHDL